jgi:signal transduction histidine kinase
MLNENHSLAKSVLPFSNHYTAKSDYSCYPSFGIVRPMAGTNGRLPCCDDLPELVAAAVADERKVIGQELHDNVNQLLTTVKLFVEMLRPESSREKDIRKKTLEYIGMAIEDIREISGELVKNGKSSKGLVQSIQLLVDDVRFTTSMGISFRYEGPVETIEETKKTALLRIVQEQLNNVIKYSQATEVSVNLSVQKESMQLSVKDNGIGFDVNRNRNGIGLSNIYDRVASHKGTIQLQTSKGHGCALSVAIPVNQIQS